MIGIGQDIAQFHHLHHTKLTQIFFFLDHNRWIHVCFCKKLRSQPKSKDLSDQPCYR